MRVSDDRYSRDFRSFHLVLRMLKHEARTNTISLWTSVSPERIRNLSRSHRREHPSRQMERHRGPSPTKLAPLMINPMMRCELAGLGALSRILSVVPKERLPNARQRLPSIASGERLCTALELFRQVVPGARLTLEQAVLLAIDLAEGDRWSLGSCARCRGVLLLDGLSPRRQICVHCDRDSRAGPEYEWRVLATEPEESEFNARLQQDLFPNVAHESSQGKEPHQSVVNTEQQPGADRKRQHSPEREDR
jgi:hypothetical protein